MILKNSMNNAIVYSFILHFCVFLIFVFNYKPQKKQIYIPINITAIAAQKTEVFKKSALVNKPLLVKKPQQKQIEKKVVKSLTDKPEVKLIEKKVVKSVSKKHEVKPVKSVKKIQEKPKKDDFVFKLSSASVSKNIKIGRERKVVSSKAVNGQNTVQFEQKFAFMYYAKIIQKKISQNWKQVFVSGKNVKCVVYFKINHNGEIFDISIHKSSGYLNFDASAISAVTASNPFPNLPEKYFDEYLGVFFSFSQ